MQKWWLFYTIDLLYVDCACIVINDHTCLDWTWMVYTNYKTISTIEITKDVHVKVQNTCPNID